MIEEIQGDVFKAKEQVLIHGCNCFCTWGKGVAKTMLRLYPKAFEQDFLTRRGSKDKLGTYSAWRGKHYYYDQDVTVINLYSQWDLWSRHDPKDVYADYDAIREGLKQVEFVYRGASFAMPRIGAGLAHGDWATIKKIIDEVFTGYKKNELVRIYFI